MSGTGFALTRRAGWVLTALAFAIGALAWILRASIGGDLPEILIVVFGGFLLIGMLLVGVTSGIRIVRGDARLRPFNALKYALIIFGFSVACHLVVMILFPSWVRDWTDILIRSTILAAVIGLHTTAYRKPA